MEMPKIGEKVWMTAMWVEEPGEVFDTNPWEGVALDGGFRGVCVVRSEFVASVGMKAMTQSLVAIYGTPLDEDEADREMEWFVTEEDALRSYVGRIRRSADQMIANIQECEERIALLMAIRSPVGPTGPL